MFDKYPSKTSKGRSDHLLHSALNGLPCQLVRAADLVSGPETPSVNDQAGVWGPAELTGRLCELCAAPRQVHLTLACAIVHEFQCAAETTVWVTTRPDTFFPPDLARAGVDLAALPVVQVPDLRAAVTVSERLTRSGAFGLVLIELGASRIIPSAALGRLMVLARQHESSLLFLTTPNTELGSLVSMRGWGVRLTTLWNDRFRYRIDVIKDRRQGPGRSLEATYRAPHSVY